MSSLSTILVVARYAVAAVFFATVLIAVVYWAIRHGRLKPFGAIAMATRRLAEPFIRPVERHVLRWGGNPQDAPLWLVGIVLVAGLLLLAFLRWLIGTVYYVSGLGRAGPRAWASFLLDLVYFVLMAALFLRVLGSWVGIGRYNRWMRIAYTLTDWMVEPIRRRLPPLGFFDLSPLVAWLALYLLRHLVLGGIFGI